MNLENTGNLYLGQTGRHRQGGQLLVPLLSAAALTGCVLLHFHAPSALHLPPCVFHQITGLYCPGCGAARALHHLMNLEFLAAMRCNFLFVAATPFLLYVFAIKNLRLLRLWNGPNLRLSGRMSWILTGVVIAWWLTRNLPFSCFVIGS